MEKKTTKSEDFFHRKPENYNCAQSILKGFQEEFRIPDEVINDFRAYGGGRAENGLCGALYAANYLIRKKGGELLDTSFSNKVSFIKCKDIRQNKCCSCADCVKIADGLLRERIEVGKEETEKRVG
jgi:hypothetical protein